MSAARMNFYNSIEAFSHALESPDITSKDPITERKHNERARLLRNGLAISGFAMVEEFFKERTGEVIDKIGDGMTSFAELPDGLRIAATAGVIEAMQFQAKHVDKASIIVHYQTHSQLVASTMNSPFKVSKLAFCNNYVNLSSAEIDRVLEAFRIDNPWSAIGGIVNRIGQGVLSPKQSFDNAAKRRHLAAHKISANTEYSELISFKKEAVMICLAYDLLISKSLKFIITNNQDFLKKKKLAGSIIEIRHIKLGPNGKWREIKEKPGSRAKIGDDYNALKMDCLLRGNKEGFSVVHLTDLGLPIEWFTPEVDF